MKTGNVLAVALLSGCACSVVTAQDAFQDVQVLRPDYIEYRGVRYPVQAPAADDVQDIYNNSTAPFTGYGAVTPDWRRRTLDDITFTPGPGAGAGRVVTGLETGFIVDVLPPAGFDIVVGFWDLETLGGIPVHSMPLEAVVLGYNAPPAAVGAYTTGLVDLTTLGFPMGGINIPDDTMNLADWAAYETGTTTLMPGVRFLMANNVAAPGAGPTVGNSQAGTYVDFDMNGSIDGTEFVAGTTYASGSNLYLRLQADVAPAVTGACCVSPGTCVQASAIACHLQGGIYRGDNVACGSDCITAGACCLLDGTCVSTDEATCVGISNGIFKGAGVACGSCPTVFSFAGGQVAIPDGLAGGGCGIAAIADIVVPTGGTFSSVDVSMNIAHTYQGDVKATLTHIETNTTVSLFDQPGGGNFAADNYGLSTNFSDLFRLIDSAPFVYDGPAVSAAIANVRGHWKPEAALSAFAGQDMAGTWRLELQDCFEADTGSLMAYHLSFSTGGAPTTCYANCDLSTTPPALNVADFTCFLQQFAAQNPTANCDNSTTVPTLNVADFTCFLQAFAAGCP